MIKPKTKVTTKGEREYKAYIENMKKIKGSYVQIGVQKDAGQYESGVTVAQVALWNEFGATTHRGNVSWDIPERSFIRSTIDKNIGLINRWREELLKQITDGKVSVKEALDTLGFRIAELIRNTIKSCVPPVNAPSTLAAKRRAGVASTTLQHTKLLLRSINFQSVVAK